LPLMMLLLHLQPVNQFEGLFSSGFWKLGTVLLAEGLSVGLAFLSFKFYESRFLRLKRFFPYEIPVEAADGVERTSAGLRHPEPAQS